MPGLSENDLYSTKRRSSTLIFLRDALSAIKSCKFIMSISLKDNKACQIRSNPWGKSLFRRCFTKYSDASGKITLALN